ncbi:uncharacterized protein [Drosophila pseudoobscura]|uniref:Uncharacterized protein isoform X1 n=1 Tax=Drosophila pseudoobscura pseudoobscura TaxID=46245 RepID=A0A0R3NXV8_DROPS|nr:uncharacterized protein LOC6903655 isoform X1 [Drosophila pseudoobscura]
MTRRLPSGCFCCPSSCVSDCARAKPVTTSRFSFSINSSKDFDWLNETQLLQVDGSDNGTDSTEPIPDLHLQLHNITVNCHPCNNSNSGRSTDSNVPLEQLVHHQQIVRLAFMALLLHILVVGVAFIIYSCVYWKSRALKRRHRLNAQGTLQLSALQHRHVPSTQSCSCHGCQLSGRILHGLIVQQFQEIAEC